MEDFGSEANNSVLLWTNLVLTTLYVNIGIIFLFAVFKARLLYAIIRVLPRDISGIYRGTQFYIALAILKWKGDSVGKIFDRTAKKYKNKIVFYHEDQTWTYAQVHELTNKVANYFASEGFKKGDSIALFMENRVEYIAIWLGLSKIGVTSALINTNLKGHPLQHSLTAVDCKAIIYGRELSSSLQGVIIEKSIAHLPIYGSGQGQSEPLKNSIDLDAQLEHASAETPQVKEKITFSDTLCYIYTSGTTGFPKAAIIKHSRYSLISLYSHYLQGVRSYDVLYLTMPLYHTAAGILGVGHAIRFGCAIVIKKKFSATNYWKDCVKYNCTVGQYIGEICRYLLAQPEGPEDQGHKVRLMIGNGLRPDIWTQFKTRFGIQTIAEFYGSTEGNCNVVNTDGKIGAVGYIPRWIYPIFFMRLVKVDNEGEPIRNPKTGLLITCQPGEYGELVSVITSGSPLRDFQGYADVNAKKKKIINDCFKKGDFAFRSGDILVMDKYGYLYFKDRSGDTFRWKGENVSTAEVESVVSRICGLKDAAVYGVQVPGQDGRAGMAAIVDPDESLDLDNLASEVVKQLPSYAKPLFIRSVKSIDQTGTYKMKKTDLQTEGFDLKKVNDPLYFFLNGKYVPLDDTLYENILAKKARV